MLKGLIFTGFKQHQQSAERPSGAYRIAHYLRSFGWDIEVIDYLSYWSEHELIELLKSRKDIKFIGLSATWLVEDTLFQSFCDAIKKDYPQIKLIIGGTGIFNENIQADYFINGFGELATKAVLDYEFGTGKKPYGLPSKNGWYIKANDFYPSWPLENYNIEYESRDFLTSTDVVTLELSRGCRFKCKYCNFPILGVKEDSSISEEQMYESFSKNYDKWGIINFQIADETINDRTVKLEKLSRAVQRCSWNPNINGFVRIDLFNSHPEQVDLLLGSRMWGHYYGVETFNHQSGKAIGKGLNPEIIKELLVSTKQRFTSSLGRYRGTIGLISGLPHETISNLEQSFAWLKTHWRDQSWVMWNLAIPRKNINLNPNSFTFEHENYGYTEMTAEEIQKEFENYIHDWTDSRPIANTKDTHLTSEPATSDINPEIFWKNENGNYFDFFRASRKIDAENIGMARHNNYTVWKRLSVGISPEDALKETCANPNPKFEDLLYQKIRNYIEKKLSL